MDKAEKRQKEGESTGKAMRGGKGREAIRTRRGEAERDVDHATTDTVVGGGSTAQPDRCREMGRGDFNYPGDYM